MGMRLKILSEQHVSASRPGRPGLVSQVSGGACPCLRLHSERSMCEHIASRRSWRNLICRALRLQCQRFDFYKAVRAQAACRGAWRKDLSGSCEAWNLFFFGLPKVE